MLQTTESDYKSILSEFLQQQVIIFGYQVVHAHLNDIKGLSFDSDGVVKSFAGDSQAAMQEIAGRLSTMNEYAVKHSLDSIVSSHTRQLPTPADVSHLPSTEQKILQTIPIGSISQNSS